MNSPAIYGRAIWGQSPNSSENPGKGVLGEVCMKDSAGKFCLDKWTRKEEEGRVGKKIMRKLPMKP
jgi:hypothetical protein